MARSPSVAAQNSWRLRDQREVRANSRRLQLGLWTIILLLFVAVLAAIFYWLWDSRYTYMDVLAIQYNKYAVPHMGFQQEDAGQFRQLLEERVREHGWRRIVSGETLSAEGTGIATAEEQFATCRAGRRDAAILYVSMHGISYQGAAYLAQSDFFRAGYTGDGFAQRLHSVKEMLKRMSDSGAGVKLLLLDAGRIAYDPRLGIVANAFPELAEKAVREMDDDRVWVLLSHSSGQVSGSDSAAGTSLFGGSVVAGLRGGTDYSQDGKITLRELYRYVWNSTTRWQVGGRALQTPRLLRGGKGFADYDEAAKCDVILAEVPPPVNTPSDEAPAKQEKAKVSDNKSVSSALPRFGWSATVAIAAVPADQTPPPNPPPKTSAHSTEAEVAKNLSPPADPPAKITDTPDSPPAVPSDAADKAKGAIPQDAAKPSAKDTAAKPVPEPPPSNPEKKPAEAAWETLNQIWQIRDALVNSSEFSWSPIDFAPVDWRRLEAWLVDYEARLRDGSVSELSSLRTCLEDLRRLSRELKSQTEQVYADEKIKPIAESWRNFAKHPQRQSLEEPAMETFRQAWRLCNRVFYELPYYVRWQAHSLSMLNQQEVTGGEKMDACLDSLADLSALLARSQDALTRDVELEIEEKSRELDMNLGELRDLLEATAQGPTDVKPDPIQDRVIDSVLATPLLNAALRLLLVMRPALPASTRTVLSEIPDDSPFSSHPWTALRTIVNWELAYGRLCDPSHDDESLRGRTTSDDGSWAEELGKRLRDDYRTIPDQLAVGQNSALVWLLDPRDQLIRPMDRGLALPSVRARPVPARLRIADVPETVPLEWKAQIPVTIGFDGQGLQNQIVTAHLEYDAELLQVRRSPEGEVLGSPAQFDCPLGDGVVHRLDLFVQPLRTTTSPDVSVHLFVQFQGTSAEDGSHKETERKRVLCKLPLPSDVGVWTRCYNHEETAPAYALGTELHPFPNRGTPYEFFLENRSRKSKTVKIQLYAIRVPPDKSSTPRDWAPGRIFVEAQLRAGVPDLVFADDLGQTIRPETPLLAEALVELPAEAGSRKKIVFQAPGTLPQAPPGPESATPAEPPAPKTPPAPPQSKDDDVSEGLVMIITNTHDATDRLVKWIGILPLHPRQYVDLRNIRFDGKKVAAEVELPRPLSVPGIAETTVDVQWTNLPVQQFTEAWRVAKLSDKPMANRSELWAEIPPNTSNCLMQLTVDGFPRAFSYAIRCLANETGQDRRDQNLDVRIVGVTPIYQGQPGNSEDKKAEPQNQEILVPAVAEDGQYEVAIRSAMDNPCKELLVRFEVDAPANAFESINPLANIRISGTTLYGDRQVRTLLESIGPEGSLRLKSFVSDFQVPVDVEGKSRLPIFVELRKLGEEMRKSQMTAILDGIPPEVTRINNVPLEVMEKAPIEFSVDVVDVQSGVANLQVAIDVNSSGKIDEGDVKKTTAVAPDARNVAQILPTTELKPNADGYTILAQVIDRVGLISEVTASSNSVHVMPQKKGVPPKLTKGSICGTLLYRNKSVSIDVAKVTIKELNQTIDVTDESFRFDDVPMGVYTLETEGSVGGAPVSGTASGVTPKAPAQAKPTDVRISLDRVVAKQK